MAFDTTYPSVTSLTRRCFLSTLAILGASRAWAQAASREQPASYLLAVVPAFAYRFDARDRSIVISGDTAPSENLVKLAHGADVLVHAAMYPAAIDRLVSRVPNAASLKASILAHQTSAEDAGRIAEEAGVKTLVLSHLVPPDDPEVTDSMWIEAAQRHFHGSVVLGKDLLVI